MAVRGEGRGALCAGRGGEGRGARPNHDVVKQVEDGGAAHNHLACHRAHRVCHRNVVTGVRGEIHSCRYLVCQGRTRRGHKRARVQHHQSRV